MYLAIRDTRISLFLISYVYRRHEGTQAHGEYKTIRRLRKEKKRYTNQHTMSIFCVPSDKKTSDQQSLCVALARPEAKRRKKPLISRAFVSHWQGQRQSTGTIPSDKKSSDQQSLCVALETVDWHSRSYSRRSHCTAVFKYSTKCNSEDSNRSGEHNKSNRANISRSISSSFVRESFQCR